MSIIGRVKIFTCKINITHAWYFKPIIGYDMNKFFFDESINFIKYKLEYTEPWRELHQTEEPFVCKKIQAQQCHLKSGQQTKSTYPLKKKKLRSK